MIRYILALLLAITALTSVAGAQTPTSTIQWKYLLETALEVNTNYVQVVTVDATTVTTATLKPTCVQAAADVVCSIVVPSLATGAHNISVSATKNNVTAMTSINNLTLGAAPKNATDFRYQINITVNVP